MSTQKGHILHPLCYALMSLHRVRQKGCSPSDPHDDDDDDDDDDNNGEV